MITRPAAPLLLLALAGCAAQTDRAGYPSLARRPIETRGFAEPDAPPPAPVTADPALDASVAALRTRLDAVVAGFDAGAAAATTRAAAAKGRAAGSEPWIAAQTALAGLDDWHAQANAIASDVERLAIDRAATLAPPYPALVELNNRAKSEATREGDTIARLGAGLAQP